MATTKRIAVLLAVLTVFGLASGCALQKDRKIVCQGLLQRGINAQAFLDVWGNPTRTKIVRGQEKIWEANWGGGGGSFYGGTKSAEVWVYEDKRVELLFSGGKKKQLAAWNTDKTVKDLATDCPSGMFEP